MYMSAETVIRKIKQKSEEECNAIYTKASEQAKQIELAAQLQAQHEANDILQQAQVQADNIIKNACQQAKTENRIELINKQRFLLDELKQTVFQTMLYQLADDKWVELFTKLFLDSNLQGEITIQISKTDVIRMQNRELCKKKYGFDGDLLAYWTDLMAKRNMDVTLCLECVEMPDGGMVLCGSLFDVDLTYKALIDNVFEYYEKQIADCLFSEHEMNGERP